MRGKQRTWGSEHRIQQEMKSQRSYSSMSLLGLVLKTSSTYNSSRPQISAPRCDRSRWSEGVEIFHENILSAVRKLSKKSSSLSQLFHRNLLNLHRIRLRMRQTLLAGRCSWATIGGKGGLEDELPLDFSIHSYYLHRLMISRREGEAKTIFLDFEPMYLFHASFDPKCYSNSKNFPPHENFLGVSNPGKELRICPLRQQSMSLSSLLLCCALVSSKSWNVDRLKLRIIKGNLCGGLLELNLPKIFINMFLSFGTWSVCKLSFLASFLYRTFPFH